MHDTDKTTPSPEARLLPTGRNSLGLRLALSVILLLAGMALGALLYNTYAGDTADRLAEVTEQLGELRTAQAVLEERNWLLYRESEALREESEVSASDTDHDAGIGTPGVFSDGVHMVDEDIAPGAYDGIVIGEVGYWARLKNTTGMVSGIVTNGLPRGPFVLTIYPSDEAIELRGVELTPR